MTFWMAARFCLLRSASGGMEVGTTTTCSSGLLPLLPGSCAVVESVAAVAAAAFGGGGAREEVLDVGSVASDATRYFASDVFDDADTLRNAAF